MEKKMKRILTVLALSLALTLSAVFVPAATNTAYAQQDRGGLLTNIPVTGDLLGEDGGTFEGLLSITGFAFQDGQLLVSGVLEGTATQNGIVTEITQTFTDVAAGLLGGGQQGQCQILFLDIGPIFLDLLGLQVDLSQIILDITAVTGPGRLLGNLLCALVGLLDGDGPLAGINNLLRNINRLLG
jgi:hypothetical protein